MGICKHWSLKDAQDYFFCLPKTTIRTTLEHLRRNQRPVKTSGNGSIDNYAEK